MHPSWAVWSAIHIGNMCTLIIIASLFQNGFTLLSVASQYGHKGVVELLLENGANVNHQNKVQYSLSNSMSFTIIW